MANLSDLADQGNPPPPGWLVALNARNGFVERGFSKTHTQGPDDNQNSSSKGDKGMAEALAQAFAEGAESARAEAATEAQAHRSLQCQLALIDEVGLQAIKNKLVDTVAAICTELLGEQLGLPEALIARCENAAGQIREATKNCHLHLHPADIAMLDKNLCGQWQIVANEDAERGGLILESADGALSDCPEDWRRAIAEALRK